MRTISILGSTGSIGTQALAIAALHPDMFKIGALTAHSNTRLLFEQVRAFRPQMAGLTGISADEAEIPDDLRFCDWRFGEEALLCAAGEVPCDDVLVSVVGMVGLPAVLAARKAGRRVLLANKEALVAGGKLVMACCADTSEGPVLIPVDSEHSAIYQCLKAAQGNPYEAILLTASGGPFRNYTREQLRNVTLAQALAHPNWSMGAKITVDSASMFNKGLEIMEARWLFDMPEDRIQVVVHPESIVHSAVVFGDGAVLAQLGVPDMRVPIGYAMSWPRRLSTGVPEPDLFALGRLTFEEPDTEKFPSLRLAREALRAGGAACTVLNGANEEAVARFLREEIAFGEIYTLVASALEKLAGLPADSIEEIFDADRRAREIVRGK